MNTQDFLPRRAALHAVSPHSRSRLLDALEVAPSVSCGEAAFLSGLSEKTVRNARRQMTREGILDGDCTLADGRERRLHVARYSSLPLVELGVSHTLFRLGDTHLDSVFAALREDSGNSREEDLAWVFRRAETLLDSGISALKPRPVLAQPVLLWEGREPVNRLVEQAQRGFLALGAEGSPMLLSAAETMATELFYHPSTTGRRVVLCVRTHPAVSARLFLRDGNSRRFAPLPAGEGLLSGAVAGLSRYDPTAVEGQVVELVGRVRSILPVDCVILETEFRSRLYGVCADLLPPSVAFAAHAVDLNTPSLAHRGALRLARRRLWESMAEV